MNQETLTENASMATLNKETKKIAIIGLGYVGLPLAVEFAKKYAAVGFDINQNRVDELNTGKDSTLEVEDELLSSVIKKEEEKQKSNDKGLQ